MLTPRSMSTRGLDWEGGALIRCIGFVSARSRRIPVRDATVDIEADNERDHRIDPKDILSLRCAASCVDIHRSSCVETQCDRNPLILIEDLGGVCVGSQPAVFPRRFALRNSRPEDVADTGGGGT